MGFFWRRIVKRRIGIRTSTNHKRRSKCKTSYKSNQGKGSFQNDSPSEALHAVRPQPQRLAKVYGVRSRRKTEKLNSRLDALIQETTLPPTITPPEPNSSESSEPVPTGHGPRDPFTYLPSILPSRKRSLLVLAESDKELGNLIPGLPNDVAMFCLSRLNLKQRNRLKSVSKSWFQFLSSTYFDKFCRSRSLFSCHLAICHFGRAYCTDNFIITVRLYQPETATWQTLPPMDICSFPRLTGFEALSCGPHIFIIGGSIARLDNSTSCPSLQSPDVSRFDVRTGKWDYGPKLQTARSKFVSGVLKDKIVIANGLRNEPPEILPLSPQSTFRWSTVEDYKHEISQEIQGYFSLSGTFWVVQGPPEGTGPSTAFVFQSESATWHTVKDFCGEDDAVVASCGRSFATVQGRIYGIFYPRDTLEDESCTVCPMEIRLREESSGEWETVAVFDHLKPSKLLRGLSSLRLVGVGPWLFVVFVEETIFDSSCSFMSSLRLSEDGKSGKWGVKGAVIRDFLGEVGDVFGAFSVEM